MDARASGDAGLPVSSKVFGIAELSANIISQVTDPVTLFAARRVDRFTNNVINSKFSHAIHRAMLLKPSNRIPLLQLMRALGRPSLKKAMYPFNIPSVGYSSLKMRDPQPVPKALVIRVQVEDVDRKGSLDGFKGSARNLLVECPDVEICVEVSIPKWNPLFVPRDVWVGRKITLKEVVEVCWGVVVGLKGKKLWWMETIQRRKTTTYEVCADRILTAVWKGA